MADSPENLRRERTPKVGRQALPASPCGDRPSSSNYVSAKQGEAVSSHRNIFEGDAITRR